MKKAALFLAILFVTCLVTQAQEDIFKKHGVTKEPLTLSKGKYKETFINKEVMQVGTVLINTRTNKVVKFLEEDTTKYAYRAEATSRFLTVDPLAEKYYSWSPYVYVGNNPILRTDPTGMDWFTNRENGNVVFVRGVEDLSSLNKEQLEKYAIGDISYYDRMGADNMFGDNVIWGIYGEKGGSFNVLDRESYSFNDLSANFMDLQGYSKQISKEHIEITEHIKYFSEPSPGSGGGKRVPLKTQKRGMKQGAGGGDFPSEVISESAGIEYKYVPKGLTDVRSTRSYAPLDIKKDVRNHLGGRYQTTKYTETYHYSAPKPQSPIVKTISNFLSKILN